MSSETAIKVIVFSGKVKDWSMWEEKFLARSKKKGYKEILTGKLTVPIESDQETEEEGKARKKTENKNEDAYSDLILSFAETEAGNVAFSIVKNAKTELLPDGDTSLAWKKLKHKYAPKTAPTEMSLYNKFHSSKLRNGEDPDIWICGIEDVRNRLEEMGTKMDERLFIMHILNNLTEEYDYTIQLLEKRNSADTEEKERLTLEELRADLSLKFERMNKNNNDNIDDDEKDAAFNAYGKFKGKCTKCGKIGHKSFQCRSSGNSSNNNSNNYSNNNSGNGNYNHSSNGNNNSGINNTQNNNNTNGGKFTGTCNYCKKVGHKYAECNKRKNDNRNRSSNSDRGSVAHDHKNSANTSEVALMSFDISQIKHECESDKQSEASYENIVDIFDQEVKIPASNKIFNIEQMMKQLEIESEDESPWQVVKTNKTTKINNEAAQLNFLQNRNIKQIAKDNCQRINGTMKQQCKLQFQDFEQYLKIFASFSFKVNTQKYNWFYGEMKHQMINVGINTVTNILNNIFYLNKHVNNKVTFTKKQLNILLRMGVEWIHMQIPSKLYFTQQPIFINEKVVEQAKPTLDIENDCASFSNENTSKISNNFWLGDTGASCHMCNDDTHMYDYKLIKSEVQVGNGNLVNAEKIGKLKVNVKQQNGTHKCITIEDCKYVPGLTTNLFSILKALSNKWDISNNGVKIKLKKGSDEIVFDQIINTETGVVGGVYLTPYPHDKLNKAIDINEMHTILGHPSEAITRQTAIKNNIKIFGVLNECHECALAKIKITKISKENHNTSITPGERICIDISSVKTTSLGGSKFWLLIMDDATRMCWSAFLKAKSEAPARVLTFIKTMRAKGYNISYIRCDNSGENESLKRECDKNILNIQFEFTGPNTPQYNGKVERRFATIYGRVRAILNEAKVTTNIRSKLWAEACNHATNIENLLIYTSNGKSAYEMFYNVIPPTLNPHVFGELVVIKNNIEIQSKMTNKGKTCMYVGPAEDHSNQVCKFLNLHTNKVIRSRNVTWLNKMYADWKNIEKVNISHYSDADDDMDLQEEQITTENTPVLNQQVQPIRQPQNNLQVRRITDAFNDGIVDTQQQRQTRSMTNNQQGRVRENPINVETIPPDTDYQIDEARIVVPPTTFIYNSNREIACAVFTQKYDTQLDYNKLIPSE